MSGIPWIDYAIAIIVIVSALLSLYRGFVREAISLLGWIIALWCAYSFGEQVAETLLKPYISSQPLRLAAAYLAVFVVVLLLAGVINFIAGVITDKTGLTSTDRLLGMIFGAVRGALIVALFVAIVGTTSVVNDTWWRKSVLIPHFEVLASELRALLPSRTEPDPGQHLGPSAPGARVQDGA